MTEVVFLFLAHVLQVKIFVTRKISLKAVVAVVRKVDKH